MITTERQLQNTRAQIARFRSSVEAMESGSLDTTDFHPAIKRAQVEALRAQLHELQSEVEEYEALRSGSVATFDLHSLAELPGALIKARIAAGLSQRQLAERLGLKEQQVQRWEASRYEGASFSRLVDVADAIGLKVHKRLQLVGTTAPEAVLSRLKSIGLDEDFIRRRLAPDLTLSPAMAGEVAERVSEIFGWAPDALVGAGTLDPAQLGGRTARFKMPKGREGRSAAVYTAYAYRLAEICAAAMANAPRTAVPTDWRAFRAELMARYGNVDFRTALRFAWDLGVVVLPLNDPGAFHGACWRRGGVNVVVLKQRLRYPARWLFDLLHELRHAGENPDAPEFEVLEGAEISDERRNSKEERDASWFSGQVVLDGRAEELVKACISVSGGDLRRMKSAVESVAAREGFAPEQLANYLAFRLSLQGENWWGPATKLQDMTYDPSAYARDLFFERFDFSRLSEVDLNLLTLALHDEMIDD